ncbi:MAG: hypothetical protein [Caudoviricetes sp.]|nr:MAG: hypothetical protein [Caudoviricetes sp.]
MQSTPFRVRHGIIVETSNNTSTAIVANNQVLTGSASNALVDLATTWNTTGNPTAIKLNVTNTASGASSALMDLQVGGSSRFKVAANGSVITGKLQHSPVPISKLLTGFDAADSDFFGKTALSGDASTLAIGASNWEGATGSNRGGVYIYDWNGSNWIQRGAVLEAADAADSDSFSAVSLSSNGSILAVGAYGWEGATGTNRGGVYIYDWNSANSSWVQRGAVLEAADAADSDFFGTCVSLNSDGSVLAAGSFNWEGATGTNRGGVYIYDWNGSSWVQRGSVLEAADAEDLDRFGGYSLSLSSNGSVLAVGAYGWEGATGTNRGGVYIYDWNGSSWVQRGSVLEPADAADSDFFGIGVSLNSDGSVLAVGANDWEGATGSGRGGVYIYDWNSANSSWVQRGAVLEAADAADSDQFGYQGGVSLSSDGSILVVSAGSWEGATGSARGAVYTYSLTGALPSYSGVATGSGWIEGANSALIGRTAGLDRITVAANGNITANGTITGNNFNSTASSSVASPSFAMGTTGIWSRNNSVRLNFAINGAESGVEVGTNLVALASTALISWTSGTLASSNPDLFLLRDSTGTLAQRYATDAQTYRIYGTYTDTSNYERVSLTANSTGHYVRGEEAGTGLPRPLYLGANNATHVTITEGGNVGIGTSSPAQKLHLVGTSGNILIRLDDAVNPRNNYIGVDNYEQVVLAANESNTAGATPYIKFRINASELVRILPSGNFGIGNLSPSRKLDVYGSGQFSDASGIQTTIWSQAASGTGGVGTNNNYPFTILTNGSERVRIDVNGNVGIGNTNPTEKLHVYGSTNIYLKAQTSGVGAAGLWLENSTGWYKWQMDSTRALSLTDSAGPNRIFVANNGNIGLGDFALSTSGATYAPKAKLDVAGALSVGYALTDTFSTPSNSLVVSGNIGVGITAPALQSGGTGIHINGTTYSEIKFTNGTTGNLATDGTAFVLNGLSFGINNREGGAISLGTSNLERISIFPDGYVGIGTNGSGIIAPTAKLTVANGTSSTSQHIYGTYTDTSNYERINLTANSTGHYVRGEEAGTGLQRPLYLGANNATHVTITEGGNVGIGTTTPGSKFEVATNSGSATSTGIGIRNLASSSNPRFELGVGYPGYYDDAALFKISNVLAGYIPSNGDWNMLTNIGIASNKIICSLSSGSSYINLYDATGLTVFSSLNAMTFSTAGNERMRIAANGNIGIGNNAPAHKLRVEGDLSVSSNTTISGNVVIDSALTITQSSLTASANISTTGIVSTNELVLSNTNVAALHRSPNAITALHIYDTSKDSDGGAWTEKCQGASWYNEPLAGKWLGSCTSEAAARLTGGPVGAEQVVDGTFASGTANWTAQLSATLTAAAGELTVTSAGNNSLAYQFLPISAIAPIRITIRLVRGAGYIAIGGQGYSLNVGDNVFNIPAGLRTNSKLDLAPNVGTTAVFSNVSVKEVTALTTTSNDYYQLSTDGKFYRLWKNWVENSEGVLATFSNVSNVTQAATTISGFQNSLFYGDNSVNRTAYKSINALDISAGGSETYSFYIQMDDGLAPTTSDFDIIVRGGGGIDGVVIQTIAAPIYRVSRTRTYASGATAASAVYGPRKLTTNSARSFRVSGHQVEYGTVATTYELKGAQGTTSEIFRGNKADFPKLAAIVAEASSVNIYDLTEPGRPMWMRFAKPVSDNVSPFLSHASSPVSSVAALNGVIAVGQSNPYVVGYYGHLRVVNFSSDQMRKWTGYYGVNYISPVGIVERNNTTVGFNVTYEGAGVSPSINNGNINAVAMTVLPDAPIDPTTGLRVPTIAVATGGGVSVIKQNGTVVNIVNGDGSNYATYVGFTRDNRIITQLYDDNRGLRVFDIPNADVTQANHYSKGFALEWYTDFWGGGSNHDIMMTGVNTGPPSAAQIVSLMGNRFVRAQQGNSDTINIVSRNRSTPTKSLLATLSPKHNTGWMVGDIRTALLSSSLTTSINGTAVLNAQVADLSLFPWSGPVTKSGSTFTYTAQYQEFNIVWQNVSNGTVNGLSWRVRFSIKRLSGSGTFVVSTQRTTINNPGKTYTPAIGETITDEFVITTSLTESLVGWAAINFLNGSNAGAGSFEIISVTVSPADGDVSYNGNGAAVFGAITRSQVATNASIVGYSGFSTSNYLRQPYNSKLDFVTSEWNASAWVNIPVTLPLANFPAIGSNVIVNGTFAADTNWTKETGWTISGGVATHTGASIGNLQQDVLTPGVAYRITMNVSGGVVNIYAGGGAFLFNLTGAIDVILVATATQVYIQCSVDGVTVDNVSYVPVSSAIIAERAHSSGTRIRLGITGTGFLTAEAYDGSTTRTVTTTGAYNTAQWLKAEANYTTDGSLAIRVNGREVAVTRGNPLRAYYGRKNLVNYSQTFSNATFWVAGFGGTIVSTNVSDPDGGTNAVEVSYANQYAYLAYVQSILIAGQQYTISFWARRNSGTNVISLFAGNNGTSIGSYTPTSTWTRYSITYTHTGANDIIFLAQDRNASGFTNLQIYGVQVELGSSMTTYVATTLTPPDGAVLTIGNNYAADAPFPGSIALLKLGATVPTYEQSQFMYDQEKQLFRANAISVLPDTGNIVDMSYDDATDRWAAVTATNESYWNGLIRNSVTASPAGSYTKISTTSGVELVSRSTTNPGVDVSIPSYGLREELVKRSESAARLTKELVVLDYVGGFTASTTNGSMTITSVNLLTYPTSYIGAVISGSGIPTNTTIVAVSGTTIYLSAAATATAAGVTISFLDFKLPVGMETKTVMVGGVVKQENTTNNTKDYARLYDGFIETIRFGVGAAPGTAAWVQIQATKGSV